MLEDKPRVLIVEARSQDDLADELLKGAVDALAEGGADHDLVTVPGVLEIPAIVALAEEGGHRPAGVRYDGYVALGCIIRGETYHFDIAAHEAFRGLMDLAIGKRLAIGNGILTVEDDEQAWARARVSQGDKGGAAAKACLAVVTLRRRLLGQSR
jgi:6,7-dimethyl-8-ribityllumazine synthase